MGVGVGVGAQRHGHPFVLALYIGLTTRRAHNIIQSNISSGALGHRTALV